MTAPGNLEEKTVVAAMKVASKFATPDSIEENVETIKNVIDKAADKNAKIIVMPETAITGYASQDLSTIWQVPGYPESKGLKGQNPTEFALEVDYPAKPLPWQLSVFEKQSTERQIYIVATFLEKQYQENEVLRRKYGDYVFYSSSTIFEPNKGMVGHYRKMNPWMDVDKSFMTAGRNLVIYDTPYGRISIAVCFDIMACLPLIKKQNVWAHFHSFAWVDQFPPVDKSDGQWNGNWFRAGLPGMIWENAGGFNFVAANWSVDKPEDWTGYGYESIYSPQGIILNQDNDLTGSGFVLAELDPPAENPPPPFPLYT